MSDERLLDVIEALPAERRRVYIAKLARRHGLTIREAERVILTHWGFRARRKQKPPPGDWMFWFIMAGRGFGKTKSAAEWTAEQVVKKKCRWGVIAPTLTDARQTCFEGVSGLLSVLPAEALLGGNRDTAWNRGEVVLRLANDTEIRGFTSEVPNRLRGPELDGAWMEELSSWDDARHGDALDTTWSNALLALRGDRLGDPKVVITSTPKANKLTRHVAGLVEGGTVAMVKGSSYENRINLPEAWWKAVVAPLEGTRTGRQEIEAELLTDVEGALWTMAVIDQCRIQGMLPGWQKHENLRQEWAEKMVKLVIAVDPNTTSGESADAAGIIVCGRDEYGHGYVLDDRTQTRGGPTAWAAAAVDAYFDWDADAVIAESNQGGEMVGLTIRGVDPTVPVRLVNANRGKKTRAEPIANLYFADEEHEKEAVVHHVGVFPDLEDEMATWTPADDSPNRMDAAVYGLWALKLWQPVASQGSFVDRGEIPGITEMGAGIDM